MVESGDTEYKKEFADSISKSVVAFSNTNGGRILVGVNDDGTIVGLDDVDSTARRCVQMIRDEVRPDVSSTTDVDVMTLDGKNLVEISVREGPNKPYCLRSKGFRSEGVYVRRGPSSIQTTETQFNGMVRNIRSTTYEMTLAFNQNLTFHYAENVFINAGIAFDEVHKNILGLKTDRGYTNLGYLISDQCDFQIKAAKFLENRGSDFMDRMEISGSLLKQLNDVVDFIRKNVDMPSKISGMKREDAPNYPMEAIREIVLNALIHRDYNSVGHTLVSIYGESIEVASPGTLVEDLSPSDLINGVSFPRNKRLSELFYRLGLVEAYGTGIPRVMRCYENTDKLPRFDITPTVFRVTIHSLNTESKDVDMEDEFFTRSDLEKRLSISKSKATVMINGMLSDGKIERIGSGKNTVYKILKKQ